MTMIPTCISNEFSLSAWFAYPCSQVNIKQKVCSFFRPGRFRNVNSFVFFSFDFIWNLQCHQKVPLFFHYMIVLSVNLLWNIKRRPWFRICTFSLFGREIRGHRRYTLLCKGGAHDQLFCERRWVFSWLRRFYSNYKTFSGTFYWYSFIFWF